MDPQDYTTIALSIPASLRPVIDAAADLGGIVLRDGQQTTAMGQHASIRQFQVFLDRLNVLVARKK